MTKLEAFQCNFVTKFYPPKPSPFVELKMMMSRSYLVLALKQIGLTTDLPQGEHQAQGAAAFPEGNSMPRESSLPRGKSILRGEQHAQVEQQ